MRCARGRRANSQDSNQILEMMERATGKPIPKQGSDLPDEWNGVVSEANAWLQDIASKSMPQTEFKLVFRFVGKNLALTASYATSTLKELKDKFFPKPSHATVQHDEARRAPVQQASPAQRRRQDPSAPEEVHPGQVSEQTIHGRDSDQQPPLTLHAPVQPARRASDAEHRIQEGGGLLAADFAAFMEERFGQLLSPLRVNDDAGTEIPEMSLEVRSVYVDIAIRMAISQRYEGTVRGLLSEYAGIEFRCAWQALQWLESPAAPSRSSASTGITGSWWSEYEILLSTSGTPESGSSRSRHMAVATYSHATIHNRRVDTVKSAFRGGRPIVDRLAEKSWA